MSADIGQGTDTCFPAGTAISMADGSSKGIEEVRVGDRVVSMSETGQVSSSTVTQLFSPVASSMCRISLAGGESLSVTGSHPMTTEGWKAIDTVAAEREQGACL